MTTASAFDSGSVHVGSAACRARGITFSAVAAATVNESAAAIPTDTINLRTNITTRPFQTVVRDPAALWHRPSIGAGEEQGQGLGHNRSDENFSGRRGLDLDRVAGSLLLGLADFSTVRSLTQLRSV
jgi:hypothetical protein